MNFFFFFSENSWMIYTYRIILSSTIRIKWRGHYESKMISLSQTAQGMYSDTNLKMYFNFLRFLDVFLDLVFKKFYFSDSYLKADSLGFKSWFYHLLALKPQAS